MKIACILFAYNRPGYLRRAIKTHRKVEGIDYYAFIDHSPVQEHIYKIIDASGIYSNIIKREYNYGLNNNIINGIDSIFLQGYDAVIVLEDDLLLAGDAIKWLREMLITYADFPTVTSVTLQQRNRDYAFQCWGWGMWIDRWYRIDWAVKPKEKNRNSWDVIVNEHFKREKRGAFGTSKARVKHIGWNGVHFSQLDRFSIRRLLRMFK